MNQPAGIVAILSRSGLTLNLIIANGAVPDITETNADTILLLNPNHDAPLQPLG